MYIRSEASVTVVPVAFTRSDMLNCNSARPIVTAPSGEPIFSSAAPSKLLVGAVLST